jgi:hypothetical protein
MNSSINNLYQKYCDDTKISFYINIAVISLIFIFLMGKQTSSSEQISRLIVILLLFFCIYLNVKSSTSLLDWKNIGSLLLNPSLAELRNNLLLNFLYCMLMFLFIIYLISDLR